MVSGAGAGKVPAPPAYLPRQLHAEYLRLWRSPVAELWTAEAVDLVADLVLIRDWPGPRGGRQFKPRV